NAPAEFAAGSQNFLASGYRGITIVPMRRGDAAIGALSVVRRAPGPLSEEQLGVLKTFASQAVIAIENARLMTETREALEQQTATAEVLGVINSSPGDLAPVFDAMLEKALRLCSATSGQMARFDGQCFHVLVASSAGQRADGVTFEPVVPDAGSVLEQIVRGKDIVHIPDVVDTEGFRSGIASRLRLVKETGARTALWVALRKENALLGAFVIYRQEVWPFTDKQIALVQNFAAQ